jgi:hypothetical protein
MRFFCHAFIILGLLCAAFGPACQFLWGGQYSIVEICTAQGIEKQIVQSDETPPFPEQAKNDCAFCLQQAHANALMPDTKNPAMVANPVRQTVSFTAISYDAPLLWRDQNPRGPPVFV